jgi:hypothetical protein
VGFGGRQFPSKPFSSKKKHSERIKSTILCFISGFGL